ncbi:BRO family protein, partial [Paenibacillus larvae]
MNQLQLFKNSQFGELEVTMIKGKPWFGAAKAATILGYKNPRDAIAKHCRRDGVAKRDVVSKTTNQYGVTSEQTVQINIITEGNLYRLITKSKLPASEKFESWVFDEVLPAIRQTGTYSLSAAPSYMIDDPIKRAEQWIQEQKQKQEIETKA